MNSNGTMGEEYAILAFKMIGWTMQRSQPATKWITGKNGVLKIIPMPSDGVADYIGYDRSGMHLVCEVKESDDGEYPPSMPCSRVTKEQREWMNKQSNKIGKHVLVFWLKLKYGTIFKYREAGAYKMGEVGAFNV